MITERKKILELRDRGAIFYLSHGGGKDAQASFLALSRFIPKEQIVIIKADLGRVDWPGAREHIAETTGLPVNVVRANKRLLGMVRHRFATRPDVPSWPSSATRQCTSDLKRSPIYSFIRKDMKERGANLALNCMGIRAEESTARSKKIPFRLNPTLSLAERRFKSGRVIPAREVYEYMPIFRMTTKNVFWLIHSAGQKAFWIYYGKDGRKGNDRMSCVFCIMASDNDLKNGAYYHPELAKEYLDTEAHTGWTMFHKTSLADRLAA